MNNKTCAKKTSKCFIVLICIGIVLMVVGGIAAYYIKESALGSRILGFGAGFGSAIFAVGVVSHVVARLKPDAARQQHISEKDERLIRIREKSAYGTYFVTLFALAIATFVFMCFDMWMACAMAIVVMFVHCISYFVFLYRNNKVL